MFEVKNDGDNLVYALEKMIRDNGDKLSAEDKEKLTKAIETAKEEFKADDVEKIRKAIDTLSKENEGIITKLYQEAAKQAQEQNKQEDNKSGEDEVIVEDDKK